MKNPFMSMFLSQANRIGNQVAGAARAQATVGRRFPRRGGAGAQEARATPQIAHMARIAHGARAGRTAALPCGLNVGVMLIIDQQ
jgi:hypothetical protein